jgi:hypothetical protein
MFASLRRLAAAVEAGLDDRLHERRRTIHGIPVVARRTREFGWDAIFRGMEAALGMVAAHHPVWLRRMSRDVAEIRVFRHPPCRGAFDPAARVVILDSYFVSTFPVATVASSLVHEATHARIAAAAPHLSYSRDRARHERICRRAEIRFARRLPVEAGREILARAAAALQGSDEEVAPPLDAATARRLGRREDAGGAARAPSKPAD